MSLRSSLMTSEQERPLPNKILMEMKVFQHFVENIGKIQLKISFIDPYRKKHFTGIFR